MNMTRLTTSCVSDSSYTFCFQPHVFPALWLGAKMCGICVPYVYCLMLGKGEAHLETDLGRQETHEMAQVKIGAAIREELPRGFALDYERQARQKGVFCLLKICRL